MAQEGTFQVVIIVVLLGLVNFSDQTDSILRLIFSVLWDLIFVCSFNETISESSETCVDNQSRFWPITFFTASRNQISSVRSLWVFVGCNCSERFAVQLNLCRALL